MREKEECARKSLRADYIARMDLNRRSFLSLALAGVATQAAAQQPSPIPPPVPAPRDWSGQTPVQYPDPDIIALDTRFAGT